MVQERLMAARCIVALAVAMSWGASLHSQWKPAEYQREKLGRGLIALRESDHRVCLSWRLLGTDPPDCSFDLYRMVASEKPVKLNASPLKGPTFSSTKLLARSFQRPTSCSRQLRRSTQPLHRASD